MKTKLGLLTYHYIPNNGAFLHAYGLQKLIEKAVPDSDVRIFSYKSKQLMGLEFLKQFKVFSSIPGFYFERLKIFNREIRHHLSLDPKSNIFSSDKSYLNHIQRNYDVMIAAMDVWCLSGNFDRPKFPNLYWFPGKASIPKFALAVSAYNTNREVLDKYSDQVTRYLNDFSVIGARDTFTCNFVQQYRNNQDGLVQLVPDPTWAEDYPKTNVKQKLKRLGVDFSRPLLGLLLFGQDELSRKICEYYRAKGFQILALSMINSFADINLGHKLTPFEWADIFQYFTLCISDRFHGTIFCLKNKTPFICIENDSTMSRKQSKLLDVLSDFDLEDRYFNPIYPDFSVNQLLEKSDSVIEEKSPELLATIQNTVQLKKQKLEKFLETAFQEFNE